tara:strand:- start:514 stop:915 length:402 start_codon:yes stop_codon:yes gene_type:complete
MKVKIIMIVITLLVSKIGFAETLHYRLFKDFVQYSSSVDAYSIMCVKGFEADTAKSELFDLINSIEIDVKLSEEDMFKLKDKYFRINKSTLSQLTQLGLNKKKGLCSNYLRVFERFDKKKNEKLDEIIKLINE